MRIEDVAETTIKDPLSETTRKERMSLLGIGIAGIAIIKLKMIPTKIEAFGIEFSPSEQKHLSLIFTSIIFYYLVAFVLYAASDWLLWRMAIARAYNTIREEYLKEREVIADAEIINKQERFRKKLARQQLHNTSLPEFEGHYESQALLDEANENARSESIENEQMGKRIKHEEMFRLYISQIAVHNEKQVENTRFLMKHSAPLSVMRMIFEFILPILIGAYAMYLFLRFAI